MIKLFDNLIHWNSKLQTVPALSTCEAEWYAIDHLNKDLLWIRQILTDIGLNLPTTKVFCDNKPTIRTLTSEHVTTKTRHVDRTFYYIKFYLKNNTFDLEHISTDQQTADIFTKSLSADKHYIFLSELSLLDFNPNCI